MGAATKHPMKTENMPRISTDFYDDNRHQDSEASFCKDQDGNMVIDIKSSIDLWRAHFNAILNDDDTKNSANDMIRPNTLDNTTPVAPPDREELAMAIQRLKLNKVSGYDSLPAELFKAAADELLSCMHHLLCNICSLEGMPSD